MAASRREIDLGGGEAGGGETAIRLPSEENATSLPGYRLDVFAQGTDKSLQQGCGCSAAAEGVLLGPVRVPERHVLADCRIEVCRSQSSLFFYGFRTNSSLDGVLRIASGPSPVL
jgi:hypothetical protein